MQQIHCVRKVAVHLTKGVWSDVHERLYRPEPELNWIKQLKHFTGIAVVKTDFSETTAHFNSNFDTDNQIYVM
jgi:predicted metal-dependent peptidase